MPLTITSGQNIGYVGYLSGEWDKTDFNIYIYIYI